MTFEGLISHMDHHIGAFLVLQHMGDPSDHILFAAGELELNILDRFQKAHLLEAAFGKYLP